LDLIASIPSYERRGKGLTTIQGAVPSPANFPSGCRFHPRCRFAVKACAASMPGLAARGNDRSVRCFRVDEISGGAK
jgi:oligopeptide/dipeptide ABC transporter ATP-binding protein